MYKRILILILPVCFLMGFKKDDIYPTPAGKKNMIFYVQRSLNKNTIVYELNTDKDGELIEERPIKMYWVNYAGNGHEEDLNFIQQRYAYGVAVKKINEEKNTFCFNFVSYKKQPVYLIKGNDNRYQAYSYFNNELIIIHRIFIKIEGGSFWLPNVKYIEVTGFDPAKNKEEVIRIIP